MNESKQKMFPIGSIVKHFKRESSLDKTLYVYEIIGYATNTETQENMVVYRALYGDFRMFVRPMSSFYSEVDKTKYPDVKQKYRFEEV